MYKVLKNLEILYGPSKNRAKIYNLIYWYKLTINYSSKMNNYKNRIYKKNKILLKFKVVQLI